MKVGALVALVLACCGPAFALSRDDAPPARGGGTSGIDIEITRTSQERLLSTGKLKVSVSAIDGGKANLFGRSSAGEGRRHSIARHKVVRVDDQVRSYRLRLTDAGLRRVARCKPRRLVAEANTVVKTDVGFADTDREDLVLDRKACDPEPPSSPRDYKIEPGGAATHTNNTPRDLTATDLGGDQVRLALFACDNLSDQNGEVTFAHSGGVATRGAPAGSITEVAGAPTAGSPQETGPHAGGGELEFTISGANGCAAPVVFRDENLNSALDVDPSGVPTESYGAGGQTSWEAQGAEFQNPGRCDPLDPAVCLQPFPNDHFTVADAGTDTGKRIALAEQSMPANRFGIHIDPAEHNRNDGFSPGQAVHTRIPGLDNLQAFEQTGAVPITDIARSFDQDAPVVVIDANTGERHLIWSEIDANPADPADVNLYVRPATNWKEGHRYIVALRDLRRADGSVISAQRPFELYRNRIITSDPAVEARRAEFEENFDKLEAAGIERDDLYLAWDFTVASERNLSERALSIRDDAFAQLGDTDLADLEVQGQTPGVLITGVTDYVPCDTDGEPGCSGGSPLFTQDPLPVGASDLPVAGSVIGPTQAELSGILDDPPEDDRIARQVEGQVVVPCYTDLPGCQTGSRFAYSGPDDTIPNRTPQNQTLANFICRIPRSAVEGPNAGPVKPSLYGHGLLGGAGEVRGGNISTMANDHGFMFCATDWAGFATQDIPTVGLALQDLSNFPKLVDRMQQGFLNFMFLGRAMIHPQGFAASPAFRFDGEPIIDTERLYYDGNSQGGILGGALVALAPDLDRGVLGVPGMNYSTLLRRSVDFAPYAEGNFAADFDSEAGLYDNYPDELERPLLLGVTQMLWDRGEMNGYAHHLSGDPLANTPDHEVLMQVAFGDHQVSMWTADVAARTMGAATNPNPLDPGRHPDLQPLFGIPRIQSFPYDGSALIYVDAGTPAPPITNTPPEGDAFGSDPHGVPRNDPEAQAQKAAFLSPAGTVVDTCGGGPCYGGSYTGPSAP